MILEDVAPGSIELSKKIADAIGEANFAQITDAMIMIFAYMIDRTPPADRHIMVQRMAHALYVIERMKIPREGETMQ